MPLTENYKTVIHRYFDRFLRTKEEGLDTEHTPEEEIEYLETLLKKYSDSLANDDIGMMIDTDKMYRLFLQLWQLREEYNREKRENRLLHQKLSRDSSRYAGSNTTGDPTNSINCETAPLKKIFPRPPDLSGDMTSANILSNVKNTAKNASCRGSYETTKYRGNTNDIAKGQWLEQTQTDQRNLLDLNLANVLSNRKTKQKNADILNRQIQIQKNFSARRSENIYLLKLLFVYILVLLFFSFIRKIVGKNNFTSPFYVGIMFLFSIPFIIVVSLNLWNIRNRSKMRWELRNYLKPDESIYDTVDGPTEWELYNFMNDTKQCKGTPKDEDEIEEIEADLDQISETIHTLDEQIQEDRNQIQTDEAKLKQLKQKYCTDMIDLYNIGNNTITYDDIPNECWKQKFMDIPDALDDLFVTKTVEKN